MERPIASLASASAPADSDDPTGRDEWSTTGRSRRIILPLLAVTVAVLGFLLLRGLTQSDPAATEDELSSLDRLNFSQVWTGDELLVFGGWGNADGEARIVFGDGAAFDPVTNQWRPLAAGPLEPRWGHEVVWTGNEMIVLGGVGVTDGAVYSPATDAWRLLPEPLPFISTGWETASATRDGDLFVWVRREDEVWRFDAASEQWRGLAPTNLIVDNGLLVATDTHLVALGVPFPDSPQILQAAMLADGDDEWQPLPELDLARNGQRDIGQLAAMSVDSGAAVVLWGSAGNGVAHRLDLNDATWTEEPGPALIDCDGAPSPALADDRIIARSYCDGATLRDPASGEWAPTEFPNDADPAPVWTGSELLGLGRDGEIYRWD